MSYSASPVPSVNASAIKDMLKTEFYDVMQSNSRYNGYSIEMENEQDIISESEKRQPEPKKIYIVVKIMPSSVNFGQIALPVTLICLSEKNSIDICQQLLIDFVQTYNLVWKDVSVPSNVTDSAGTVTQGLQSYMIQQAYTAPEVVSNFNEMYHSFVSLFYVTGSLLITQSAIICSMSYYDTLADFQADTNASSLGLVAYTPSSSAQPDSQAFYGSNDHISSVNKVMSDTITFSTFFTANSLMLQALKVHFGTLPANTPFYLKPSFAYDSDGTQQTLSFPNIYRQISMSISQNAGAIAMITITYIR
jgi:hypothetical protein